MNEDINQECKVVAFEYFQQNISSWENWHIDHSATINQILGIYKKQLSEEKDNILKQINIGFNEQFETNLNNYVTEFNKLSKQYLDVVDNYDIDLSNEISKYIFAYNDYIEKQTILNSIQGPPVIDNNVLENIIRTLSGEIEIMEEKKLTKKATNVQFVKTKNEELAQNVAKISETKEAITKRAEGRGY